MNPVRPQNTPESPTLLNDLKAEVSAESAPLLQFIVRNSGLIVGVVVVLLVALVGTRAACRPRPRPNWRVSASP